VGGVGPLLEDRRRAVGDADLVPAHAGRGPRRDRVVHDQRFVVGEVAVGEAEHEAVGQRIELLGRSRLRDAGAAAAGFAVGRGGKGGRAGEGGIRRRGEVDVELPEGERVGGRAQREDIVGRSGGRQAGAVEIGGKQAGERGAGVEALLGGGRGGQAVRAVG